MPQKPKNPDWKADLEYFLDKGISFHKACNHAQVSPITARIYGYGVKRRLLIEYHDEIVKLRKERNTFKQIGEILGFNHNAISSYCRLHGIKKGVKPE